MKRPIVSAAKRCESNGKRSLAGTFLFFRHLGSMNCTRAQGLDSRGLRNLVGFILERDFCGLLGAPISSQCVKGSLIWASAIVLLFFIPPANGASFPTCERRIAFLIVWIGIFRCSSLEAMACGLPVTMRLEHEQYDALCETGAPPVLEADTAHEVYLRLKELSDGAEWHVFADSSTADGSWRTMDLVNGPNLIRPIADDCTQATIRF